jgi:ribosomal protein S3
LFEYVQIFVISNGVNTKYFSNNPKQSFEQTFYWTDADNKKITKLDEFTDLFLEKCNVSEMIAEGLEKRLPFRRVMKQTIEKVMANRDVKGVRVYCGGRLGGSEIARSEELKKGRVPLQTLRADIDYAEERAHMTYGDLGIKVWIYKGEIFNKDKK